MTINSMHTSYEAATFVYRHGEDDYSIWYVDLPTSITEQVKAGQRMSAENLEMLLNTMPVASEYDSNRVSLLAMSEDEVALYSAELGEEFFEAYSHKGCSIRGGLYAILDELDGPEEKIDIMWDDLKPEAQKRIERMLGDNGNFDIVPITTIYAPELEQDMQM